MRKQLVRTLAAGAVLSISGPSLEACPIWPQTAEATETAQVRFVPTPAGDVVELEAGGAVLWSARVPAGGKATYVVNGGQVAVLMYIPGSKVGTLTSIDASTGKELWNRPIAVEENVDEAVIGFVDEHWDIQYTGFPYDQHHTWTREGVQVEHTKQGKCCYNPPPPPHIPSERP